MQYDVQYDAVKDSGKRQEFFTGAVRDTNEGKGRFDLLPPIGMKRLSQSYNAKWQEGEFSIAMLLNDALLNINNYMEGWRDIDHLIMAAGRCLASAHLEYMIFNGFMTPKLLLGQCYISSENIDSTTNEWWDAVKNLADHQENIAFGMGEFDKVWVSEFNFAAISPIAIERLAKHFENGAMKYGDNNWQKGIAVKRFLESGNRHINKYFLGNRDEDHLIAAAWNYITAAHTEEMVIRKLMPFNLLLIQNYIPQQDLDKKTAKWWEMVEDIKRDEERSHDKWSEKEMEKIFEEKRFKLPMVCPDYIIGKNIINAEKRQSP